MSYQNLLLQEEEAQRLHLRVVAKMQDMERRGIVRHDGWDSWTVLDQEAYNREMGTTP